MSDPHEALDALLSMYRHTVESDHWKNDGQTKPWLMVMPDEGPPAVIDADTAAYWPYVVDDYPVPIGALAGVSDARGQVVDPALLDTARSQPTSLPNVIVGFIARDDGHWGIATQGYDQVGGEHIWGEVTYPGNVAGTVPELVMLLRKVAWGYEEDDQ